MGDEAADDPALGKRLLPLVLFTGRLGANSPGPVNPAAPELQTRTFKHFSQCLRWCKAHPPAAALIDHDTAGKHGIAFAQRLRAQGFANPIFLASSRVDAVSRLTAGLAITGIYEKPVDAAAMGRDMAGKIAIHRSLAALRGGLDPKKLPTPDVPRPQPGSATPLPPGESEAAKAGSAAGRKATSGPLTRSEAAIRAAALGAAAIALALILAPHSSKKGRPPPTSLTSTKTPHAVPPARGSPPGDAGPPALAQTLGKSEAQTSLVVLDKDGKLLFARSSGVPLAPASTLKLIVAAAAYADLNRAFRFTTTLASQRAPQRGVLGGDLILRGDGDPTLHAADFDRAGIQLRQAMRVLKGRLLVETRPFQLPEQNPQWSSADRRAPYAAGSSAVSLDGNLSGGAPVTGIARHVAGLVAERLRARGIVIGAAGTVSEAAAPWVGWKHQSPLLPQIVSRMLSESDNLFAEQLLRKIGQERFGTASTAAGIRAEFEVLRRLHVETDGLDIRDGSGLAPGNRATAQTIARVLQRVGQTPWASLFYKSLPLVGVEGTTAGRILGASRGRVRAKDGHLQNANSLAGYVDTAHHGRVSFAFIANEERLSAQHFETMEANVMDVLASY